MQSTGSLVDNRSNPYIFIVLGVFALAAVVFTLIMLLQRFIKAQHSSQKWLEAQKKVPTKKKNVDAVAQNAHLTPLEAKVLYDICKKYNAPNIEYLVRDDGEINTLCKNYFNFLYSTNASQEEQYAVFTLRFKLEKMHDMQTVIRSTQQLQNGASLSYITPDKSKQYSLKVYGSDAKTLSLSLSDSMVNSGNKPAELAKIKLSFTGESGITYQFDTRVIRYETAKDGKAVLVVSHAPTITSFQKRQTKRKAFSEPCTFYAAKDSGQKERDGSMIFNISQNAHEGKLRDISAGGCCMLIPMGIAPKQYMKIDFTLGGEEKTAIAYIVNVTKNGSEGGFNVHLKFDRIEAKTRTRIYAEVYGYLQ